MTKLDHIVEKILELRAEISEVNEKLEELQTRKADYESQLMNSMASVGASTLGTTHGTASLKKSTKFVITDWNELLKYIVETESFDILQKRIATNSVKDRINNEENVPGITGIEVFSVSIRSK